MFRCRDYREVAIKVAEHTKTNPDFGYWKYQCKRLPYNNYNIEVTCYGSSEEETYKVTLMTAKDLNPLVMGYDVSIS